MLSFNELKSQLDTLPSFESVRLADMIFTKFINGGIAFSMGDLRFTLVNTQDAVDLFALVTSNERNFYFTAPGGVRQQGDKYWSDILKPSKKAEAMGNKVNTFRATLDEHNITGRFFGVASFDHGQHIEYVAVSEF
jgi:hypothetical protein